MHSICENAAARKTAWRWVAKHHLVRGDRLERDAIWVLLRFIGFKTSQRPEFSHNKTWDHERVFGDCEGARDSDKAVGEKGGENNDLDDEQEG